MEAGGGEHGRATSHGFYEFLRETFQDSELYPSPTPPPLPEGEGWEQDMAPYLPDKTIIVELLVDIPGSPDACCKGEPSRSMARKKRSQYAR